MPQLGTFFTSHNFGYIYIINEPHFRVQIPHFWVQMYPICGILGTFYNFSLSHPFLFQPKSNFILLILYPYTSIKIISCKLNQFLVSIYLFNFYTHFKIFTTHLFTTNKNHTLILLYIH